MQLSQQHIAGLEKRGIDPELAIRMGTFTGRQSADDRGNNDIVPDETGNLLCFPHREGGNIVQVKGRWRTREGQKRFTQITGRPKTFYNADVLIDPADLHQLQDGTIALLITEGEFDCLTAIMAGHWASVSVPNGAPPARDQNGKLIPVPRDAEGIDFENDDAFSYLVRHIEALSKVDKFIIATDDDEPGQRLAKELVRRLGPARCMRIVYPKGEVVPDAKTGELRACKDLDEVRQHYGIEAVARLIETCKEWPVAGLYNFSDYPTQELDMVLTRLSPELDECFKPYAGALIVVTGVPNTGKSETVKQMAVNVAQHYGWHTAIFPGEEMVKPFLEDSLKTKILQKHKSDWSPAEDAYAQEFLERHFAIIGADPREDLDDDDITIGRILENASAAVFRYGTRLLVLDPWNEIDHSRPGHITLTEYVGDTLRTIKRWARRHGVCVIIVAHPKKVEGQPNLYDISDSAHWFNKADLGLVIDDRGEPFGTLRDFLVCKVRFVGITGRKANVPMNFDTVLHMYRPYETLNDNLRLAGPDVPRLPAPQPRLAA